MKLIDNINSLLGDELKNSLLPGAKLKIAASCFSIYAYEALKQQLEQVDELEFIFTAPTFVEEEAVDKLKKEKREFHIPDEGKERAFFGSEFEIQLKNKLTQKAIARECADWIRRKAKFRSNLTSAPMQQFAIVESAPQNMVYQPLQGFTAVDLGYQKGNAVSNLVMGMDEVSSTQTFLSVFDQVWHDKEKLTDVTDRLVQYMSTVYQENPPEQIYFQLLYNLFNEFLEDINEDVLPNDKTGYRDSLIWQKLFNYQRDAATGIINKLETYNGCILADSVGLGKTFTALAVVKYYELRNKSVLVLCPKKLAENWTNYNSNFTTNPFVKDRFNFDVLCHTDLQRTKGESLGMSLSRVNWGNYDLVVIDESHNFRNNQAYKEQETRYQALMNRVIRAGVKTKVLMLSATPVNNKFSDLKNQLALAYEGDSATLHKKLDTHLGIDEIFKRAQKAFNNWAELEPEKRTATALLAALDFDFFRLLDSVTIARSRRHIQTFYDTKDIGRFPTRNKPLSFQPPLTQHAGVIGFNEIFEQLSGLRLAVYAPVSYILPSRMAKYEAMYDTNVQGGKSRLRQADREKALQRLMTINLLKRLESSVQAFRLTLQGLQRLLKEALGNIDAFKRKGSDSGMDEARVLTGARDWDLEDEGELEELADAFSTGGTIKINLADMDILSWERHLSDDLNIIDGLLTEMAKVTPQQDAKLAHLKNLLQQKWQNPINPGNRKVLLFTAFADTADYLYEQLAPLCQQHRLHLGKVTGSSAAKSTVGKGYDFQSLLTLFSPRSKEKAHILPDEPAELDLLIGTDCISEGQNLQDCDYLVNYDIHWNPVRIIQRFGRVDRIGSLNECIQLVNYWPDISLDEYINLKERVENRMVISDLTSTGDDNVLTAQANDVAYRKEQLKRLQEEVIDLEDVKSGISITDLGLNEFRMDLLNYLKTHPDITHLPNGLHTVVAADPARGLIPGVIFALRNRHAGVNIDQQNRLHPYYLIYMADNGDVAINHLQAKPLLDRIRAACKGKESADEMVCQLFNQVTQDGRKMAHYSALLDQAIHAMVAVKEQSDIDSLFSGGPTTALKNEIAGLDQFELINFIVVQG
ncbi:MULTISPECIES: SNF2-related protein [unclassified Aeromonas]|uniref:SNF2-related protein n=1 Tax=unclassified Aeromonas TaxID=257493 RepID=UPI000CD1AEBD|nr:MULTISPECIES: SNF2-related protein [unclassified Aeromonas]AUV13744.1 helicase [Aeromonas sp. ASNIH3]BBQ24755.1 helicase [Aeromonas sp. WP2-W18-CRE-05]